MPLILVIKNLRSFAAKIFDMGKSKPTKKTAAKAKPAAKKTSAKPQPLAKKAAVKTKPATKKAAAKPAKKVVKSAAKKAAVKPSKKISKPATKKAAAKPAKAVAKPLVKKAAPKTAKNVAKPASKKTVEKTITKKIAPKPVSKKPAVKKPVSVKPAVQQIAKPAVSNQSVLAKSAPSTSPKHEPKSSVKNAEPKKIMENNLTVSETPQLRYSDEDLREFKDLIEKKLELAREELKALKESLDNHNESLAGNKSWNMEEGSDTTEMEYMMNQISRQHQYLRNLEAALVRIENKTYGICRATGKLIAKERLRLVPHATLSVEAKLNRKPEDASPGLVNAPFAGSDEVPSFSSED